MDNYFGTIALFAFGFTPRGWMLCDGKTLEVRRYSAVYALLGNSYGGDYNNFALPNLNTETVGNIKGGHYYICIEGIFPRRS